MSVGEGGKKSEWAIKQRSITQTSRPHNLAHLIQNLNFKIILQALFFSVIHLHHVSFTALTWWWSANTNIWRTKSCGEESTICVWKKSRKVGLLLSTSSFYIYIYIPSYSLAREQHISFLMKAFDGLSQGYPWWTTLVINDWHSQIWVSWCQQAMVVLLDCACIRFTRCISSGIHKKVTTELRKLTNN